MKYQPPYGSSNSDASYINATPGQKGSPVPAQAIEHPQREIVNVIKKAGLTPKKDDLGQLHQAIQQIVKGDAYTLTPATANSLGGVMVNKKGLAIDNKGQISVSLLKEGGLAIDTSGCLRVNPDAFSIDILRQFLKTMRLPEWLTANRAFYVRPDGNNNNDGSKNTPDGAFKTINYALNYIADNYNLGNKNVYIYVSSGLYKDQLILPKYSATSGKIHIIGENKLTTRISVTNASGIESVASSGVFVLRGLGIDVRCSDTDDVRYLRWINAGSGTVVNVYELDCIYTAAKDSSSVFYGLEAGSGGRINIYNGFSATIANQSNRGSSSFFTSVGDIYRMGTKAEDDTAYLSGECTQCLYALGGYFYRNTAYSDALFAGNVVGKKYMARSGGRIDTGKAGADYFPGTRAGTLESSTYSWYN